MTAALGSRPDQVVEIWAGDPDDLGQASFGSGYLVSSTLVLTARHVIRPVRSAGSSTVRNTGPVSVVFSARSPDQPLIVDADVAWEGAALDMALVRVRWPAGEPPWKVTAAALGDIPNPGWQVKFSAMGYPKRKARPLADGDVLRDCDEVHGEILALRNVRSGLLDLSLTVDPAGPGKAWSGFSGAAVFAHGFLVGVIIKAERVTAGFIAQRVAIPAGAPVRLYPEFMEPPQSIAEFRELLADDGNDLTVYPARRKPGYYATIEKIPPAGGPLDRDAELAEMRTFARPSQGGGSIRPYADWVASAWAGKTALAGHFARHPPAGVDVVAFFVSRPRGQQTAQFLKHACDQLAALVNRDPPVDPDPGTFADLWDDAAAEAQRSGRTLVLLIDGLDENDTEVPTVASLIPDIPGDDERTRRVLLLRRDPPELDVADGHSLLRAEACIHKTLVPSPLAEARRQEARRILRESLRDGLTANALGIIAAAGPLRATEIAAVRRAEDPSTAGKEIRLIASDEIRPVLRKGVERGLLWPTDDESQAYAFQHADLLEITAAELGEEAIQAHRDAVFSWADSYADLGWPKDTPAYLLTGYPAFLAQIPDAARLAALTTPARIERLRASTGDDAAVVDELTLSLRALAAQDQPELALGFRLALRREALLGALARYPADLICAHARLGHWSRAGRLAARLEQSADQVRALAEMGAAAASARQFQLADEAFAGALTAAAKIRDSNQRSSLVVMTAQSVTRVGRLLDPRVVAAKFPDPAGAVGCLTTFAFGYALNGDVDYAELFLGEACAAARPLDQPPANAAVAEHRPPDVRPGRPVATVVRPGDLWPDAVVAANAKHRGAQNSLTQAASAVARKAVELERLDVAIRVAAGQPDPISRLTVVRELARAVAAGPADKTDQLLADVQADAAGMSDPRSQAALLSTVAQVLAPNGRPAADLIASSARAATRIEEAGERAPTLAAVAQAAAAIGLPADDLLASARQAAALVSDDTRRLAAQSATAQVAALIGRVDLARQIVADVRGAMQRAWARAAVIYVLTSTWQFEALRMLGADMPDRAQRDWAWGLAAVAAAACGQLGTAWTFASYIIDPELRDQAYAGIAGIAARAGQIDAASQTVAAMADPGQRAMVAGGVASAIAWTGQIDVARRIVMDMPEPGLRTGALVEIAKAATAAGQVPAALAIAEGMPDSRWRVWALYAIINAAGTSGRFAEARQVVAMIDNPIQHAAALVLIAQAACNAREFEIARAVAHDVTIPGSRAGVLAAAVMAAGPGPLSDDMLAEAREAADAVTYAAQRAQALANIAWAAAATGHAVLAMESIREAEACALAGDPGLRASVLAAMARAADHAPDYAGRLFDQACQAADVADQIERCMALARIGRYAVGRPGWSKHLSAESARAADVNDPADRSTALDALVQAADDSGHEELARDIAKRIPIPGRRIDTLLYLAKSAVARARPDQADSLFAEAVRVAQGSDAAESGSAVPLPWKLQAIAEAAASCLRLKAAQTAAAAIGDEAERARITYTIDIATEVTGPEPGPDAEGLPWYFPPPSLQNFEAQSVVAVAAWAAYHAGWLSIAASLVSQLNDPSQRSQLLVAIAEAAVAAGDPVRTSAIIDRAMAGAGPVDRSARARLLALNVRTTAATDATAACRALAVGIADCFSADLVLAAADLGHHVVADLAEELGV